MSEQLERLNNLVNWRKGKIDARCVEVIDETHDVKTFRFRAEPEVRFHFKPGQFVGIEVEIAGQKHIRSYTIASSPSRPYLLELTIKKEQGGTVSPWLHDNIKVGSRLTLRGPAGRFNCFDIDPDKVLLIGAGSGITPLMSMLRYWTDTAAAKDIVLLNWARSAKDIIFRRELAQLDFRHRNLRIEVICTQPDLNDNWLGRRGRINPTTLLDMVPDLHQRTVFCCGPDGFMQSVKECLAAHNFDMQHYHDESFDPGGKKKKALAARQQSEASERPSHRQLFQVELVKSGRVLDIYEDENLLEKLEQADTGIDSACRQGNCGTCQVRKIDGVTRTENETGLDDEARKEGYILTCTTRALSDLKLDL